MRADANAAAAARRASRARSAAARRRASSRGMPVASAPRRRRPSAAPPVAPPTVERRPSRPFSPPRPDRAEEIRDRLRTAPAFAHIEVEVDGDDEFVLLVARRDAGGLSIVAPINDRRLTDQAIRKAAA